MNKVSERSEAASTSLEPNWYEKLLDDGARSTRTECKKDSDLSPQELDWATEALLAAQKDVGEIKSVCAWLQASEEPPASEEVAPLSGQASEEPPASEEVAPLSGQASEEPPAPEDVAPLSSQASEETPAPEEVAPFSGQASEEPPAPEDGASLSGQASDEPPAPKEVAPLSGQALEEPPAPEEVASLSGRASEEPPAPEKVVASIPSHAVDANSCCPLLSGLKRISWEIKWHRP